jgi:segregation and condensation protein A
MDESVKIKLSSFEGPLDLLLHLIREQKVDIYDIPIAEITQQYLEYLEMMKELNLEIAGDFIVMAATLIHIKSRMLLPIEDTAGVEESEDPRLELVLKLLEYRSFKDAAQQLKEREDEWSEVLPRSPLPEEEMEGAEPEPTLFDLNLFDLLSAFRQVLDQAPPEVRKITRESLTIKGRMNVVLEALSVNRAVRFEHLFADGRSLAHYLMTFIAVLELIRLGLARVYQEHKFGTIWVINPEAEIKEDEFQRLASDPFRLVKIGSVVVATTGALRSRMARVKRVLPTLVNLPSTARTLPHGIHPARTIPWHGTRLPGDQCDCPEPVLSVSLVRIVNISAAAVLNTTGAPTAQAPAPAKAQTRQPGPARTATAHAPLLASRGIICSRGLLVGAASRIPARSATLPCPARPTLPNRPGRSF